MPRTGVFLPAFCLSLCALLVPGPAAAQGNGRGNAFGHNKRPSTGGGSTSTAASSGTSSAAAEGGSPVQPQGTGIRNFGSWLDDASVMAPGSGFMSFAVGYWRMPGFTEFDVPAFDVGLGVTNRVQVGASVPVYHAGEPGGPIARGLGDMYLSSKIQLRDPAGTGTHIGFAIVPVLEWLSVAPAEGSRASWALPGAVELQGSGWRTYGSAGYFSRGSVFAAGALEVSVSRRAWVTGTISQSRSVKRDDLSEALGFAKGRTDVSGGLTFAASDAMALFGNVGRTLSTVDPNRAILSITGGLAVNFAAWGR
jgi:hypothetical protein